MRIFALFLATASSALAQTPPQQQEPPVQMGKVEIETASLPGSSLVWTKIVTNFTTTQKWLDGISFSAMAILAEGQTSRVVAGSVRYSNIPAGRHQAILYLSPRATARFGTPSFVQVTVFHNDAEAGEASWTNPSKSAPPADWRTLNTYGNILVPVTRTPWILLDYERTPDLSSN